MKISVVVPMYRVEKYIEECIQSIIQQSYDDLEIILVDDGSPDRCGSIADAYMEQDDRIQVIHQKNQGLSAARNTGLKKATGEYVAFVDSDDYLDINMYKMLVKEITNNEDIIICNYDRVDAYSNLYLTKPSYDNFRFYDQKQIEKCFYRFLGYKNSVGLEKNIDCSLFVMPWNKLYKRSFLNENMLEYDITFKAHEDTWFNYNALKRAKSIVGTNYVGYHFRMNVSSITRSFKPNRLELNDCLYHHIFVDNIDILENKRCGELSQILYSYFIGWFEYDLDSYVCHPLNYSTYKDIRFQIEQRTRLREYRLAFSNVRFGYLTKYQIIYVIAYKLKCYGVLYFLSKLRQKRKQEGVEKGSEIVKKKLFL